MPVEYEIVVQGRLGPGLIASFDRMSASHVGGRTRVLVRERPGRDLLHLLGWLSDAGTELVELRRHGAAPRSPGEGEVDAGPSA